MRWLFSFETRRRVRVSPDLCTLPAVFVDPVKDAIPSCGAYFAYVLKVPQL